jgi:cysteine-rich repeat protein
VTKHSTWGIFCAAAVALLLGSAPAGAQTCFQESECTFEKPNVLVVMDYSSSMVEQTFGTRTRWVAELDAVRGLIGNRNFTDDMHLALMRFGHDPGAAAGTTLPGDTSVPPITDGVAIDVPFDDPTGKYAECNAAALTKAVDGLPPPPSGRNGIGTWTRGALDAALALVTKTRANHPTDTRRVYEVVLMTDGDWNCKASSNKSTCPIDNPSAAAAALLAAGVRVHVVAFGDGTTAVDLDTMAKSGGTGAALDAASPQELTAALGSVLQGVRDAVVVPECVGGLPRVMIIMDASSSMLAGVLPGDSNWDKARYAIAGNRDAPNPGDPGYVTPLFDRTLQIGSHTVAIEDVVHIGLMGFSFANKQKLMLQYSPCSRDNIEWAMNPYTSCVAPGCADPYTDPDTGLTFTSVSSDRGRNPPFVEPTTSFMPVCNPGGAARCMGLVFNTYTGEGVNLARVNIARYTSNSGPFQLDPGTPFVNILITDGMTSPDDAVDPVPILADMQANGVPTYVIGFGAPTALDGAQLDAYAAAGGTGKAFTVDPSRGGSADALAAQIASVIGGLKIDPCCQLNDCSVNPEPPLPLCGNSKVDQGEACDAGTKNGAFNGTCSASCSSTTYCGDGVVNGPEECDDANAVDTDGCSTRCTRDPGTGAGGSSGVGGRTGGGASSGTSGASGNGAGGSSGGGGAGASTGSSGTTGGGAASGNPGGRGGASGSGAASGSITGSGTGARGSVSGSLLDGGVLGADGGAGAAAGGGASAHDNSGCACRSTPTTPRGGAGRAWLLLGLLGMAARRRARSA